VGLASLAYVVKRLGLRPRDLRRRGVKYRLQSVVFFVQQFCCFMIFHCIFGDLIHLGLRAILS